MVKKSHPPALSHFNVVSAASKANAAMAEAACLSGAPILPSSVQAVATARLAILIALEHAASKKRFTITEAIERLVSITNTNPSPDLEALIIAANRRNGGACRLSRSSIFVWRRMLSERGPFGLAPALSPRELDHPAIAPAWFSSLIPFLKPSVQQARTAWIASGKAPNPAPSEGHIHRVMRLTDYKNVTE